MIKQRLHGLSLGDFWEIFLKNLRSLRPPETFLALGLVFGLLFFVLTPPMQVPDEVQHFYRAYQVSEFHFDAVKVGNGYGGSLPVSVETVAPLLRGNIPGNDSRKVKGSVLKEASKIKLNPNVQAPVRFDNTAINSAIVYFPQAIGVGIGRILHLNPFWLIYLGRLTNLIIWLALIYLAIRLTPISKWGFVVVALIPVSVSQSASLSSDAMQIGVVALFIAVLLRLRIKVKPLNTKYLIGLGLLIATTALLKAFYVPLILAIFLIPKRIVSTRLKFAMATVGCIIALAWSLSILPMAKSIPSYLGLTTSVNSTHQIQYIKHHPTTYVSTVATNIFGPPGSAVAPSYLGIFGWNDTTLPYWIQAIVLLTLAAALLYREESSAVINSISTKVRLWLGLLIAASFVVLYLFLFTGYTPYGATIIQGVQGRYFIPLTFLLIPITAQSIVQLKIAPDCFRRLIVSLLSFGLVASLVTVAIRFY